MTSVIPVSTLVTYQRWTCRIFDNWHHLWATGVQHLPDFVQNTFIILGYIGLLLIVFEAGLSTDITLLYTNVLLSSVVALSGVIFPVGISMLLLSYGYGYTLLQAFGAGTALCSTSLGTTLALLRPELRRTRTGAILLSAALLDDIIGLIFAAIIPNLPYEGSNSSSIIPWHIIARPILVSFGFGFLTFMGAYSGRKLLSLADASPWRKTLYTGHVQLFITIATLSGFVAGAKYAGTSELFGAYLAGTFLAHVFPSPAYASTSETSAVSPHNPDAGLHTPGSAFAVYILPLLQRFLSPIFFASIGTALPIRSLVLVDGSRRVIWRGIVYSLLMIIAKAVVGLWILVWPDRQSGHGWCGTRPKQPRNDDANEPNRDVSPSKGDDEDTPVIIPRTRSAALVGLAMVARGEIALIVAQLARPLLAGDAPSGSQASEPFAVVIWAILVTTVGGAVGVGLLLRSWDR
ncbi:hypothetical protein D9615_003194 [Tricholomella constricta]|uniref:Cation/H+ exchanger transmembrane domain-containing protein n=1 Tax=Tricholomella constricta TaxID=117010 RepID=A0A8H5HJH8_9AGAR|nr:hypothetical protein D9615_003194 [Tricholomella constricta]